LYTSGINADNIAITQGSNMEKSSSIKFNISNDNKLNLANTDKRTTSILENYSEICIPTKNFIEPKDYIEGIIDFNLSKEEIKKNRKKNDIKILLEIYKISKEFQPSDYKKAFHNIAGLCGGMDGISFNDKNDSEAYYIRNKYGFKQRSLGNKQNEDINARIDFEILFRIKSLIDNDYSLPGYIFEELSVLLDKVTLILYKEHIEDPSIFEDDFIIPQKPDGNKRDMDKIKSFVKNEYPKLLFKKITEEITAACNIEINDKNSVYAISRKFVIIGELFHDLKDMNLIQNENNLFSFFAMLNGLRNDFVHFNLHLTLINLLEGDKSEEIKKEIHQIFSKLLILCNTSNSLLEKVREEKIFAECKQSLRKLLQLLNTNKAAKLRNKLLQEVLSAKQLFNIIDSKQYYNLNAYLNVNNKRYREINENNKNILLARLAVVFNTEATEKILYKLLAIKSYLRGKFSSIDELPNKYKKPIKILIKDYDMNKEEIDNKIKNFFSTSTNEIKLFEVTNFIPIGHDNDNLSSILFFSEKICEFDGTILDETLINLITELKQMLLEMQLEKYKEDFLLLIEEDSNKKFLIDNFTDYTIPNFDIKNIDFSKESKNIITEKFTLFSKMHNLLRTPEATEFKNFFEHINKLLQDRKLPAYNLSNISKKFDLLKKEIEQLDINEQAILRAEFKFSISNEKENKDKIQSIYIQTISAKEKNLELKYMNMIKIEMDYLLVIENVTNLKYKQLIIEHIVTVIGQYICDVEQAGLNNQLFISYTSKIFGITSQTQRSKGLAHEVLTFDSDKFKCILQNDILPAYEDISASHLLILNKSQDDFTRSISIKLRVADAYSRFNFHKESIEYYNLALNQSRLAPKCHIKDYLMNMRFDVENVGTIIDLDQELLSVNAITLKITQKLSLEYLLLGDYEKAHSIINDILKKIELCSLHEYTDDFYNHLSIIMASLGKCYEMIDDNSTEQKYYLLAYKYAKNINLKEIFGYRLYTYAIESDHIVDAEKYLQSIYSPVMHNNMQD
jgi:hypothetical protein